jgi:nicotinate-nucleotide adenylyltransferase
MHYAPQAIGILGGTFDPIHFGHLRMALELHQALNLTEVRLVPCFQPVHRKSPMASAEDRLAMIEAAIIDEPALKVDDCEIIRQGPSYMIDTLIHLRKNNPDVPLCLIMGIDALLGLPSWHRYEEILTLAHLVIAHRPQYTIPQTGTVHQLIDQYLDQDPAAIHESRAGTIILQPVTALDISATDIRKQIAMGKSPRYLLPENVNKYIKEHGIYSICHI